MSIDSEAMVWFLMRAAYGQEQKAQEFLEAKGIETFLPLQEHCFVRDGKRMKKMQSLIPAAPQKVDTERWKTDGK